MEWKEIKKAFEEEVLCPALRGRLSFEYTDYDYNHDGDLGNCLSIYYDGRLFYKFETKDYTEQYALMCGQLREIMREVLSQNYMSREDAEEATWKVTRQFMPWLTSQNGIMRAEAAVQHMEMFIENPSYDIFTDNQFTCALWLLSINADGKRMLANAEAGDIGYADDWRCAFEKLRVEAERDLLRNTANK